jgi:hypothetical protein
VNRFSHCVVDRLLSPQTIVHFIEFSLQGVLPTGKKTSLNLVDEELIASYFFVPYAEWSPGPHDQFSESPIQHVQIRIGSHEDSDRLVIVEKRVHAMKSRLWESVVSISDTRWRQKDLDAVENHQLACLYTAQAIEVFKYLQTPLVQDALTQTYTLIHGHLRDFDRAVNKLAEREGQPTVQLAALWEEFMTAYYTVMATRAHNWVISKTNHLRDLEEQRLAAFDPTTEEYNSETLAITNRIQDLSSLALEADGTIFIGMPNSDPPVSNIIPPLNERAQRWQTDLKIRTRELILKETMDSISSNRTPDATGSPSGELRFARLQREAHEELRVKWRGGPITLPPPGWITKLKNSMVHEQSPSHWGFNVYRLSYKASDAEWAEFVRKFEADINNWGEGEPGAEGVKPLSKLTWLDGRELGLPEDDIAAVRK